LNHEDEEIRSSFKRNNDSSFEIAMSDELLSKPCGHQTHNVATAGLDDEAVW
jgi:hypothetical protein